MVAGLVQDGQPRGAAVPVEGLAGGVLGSRAQDGHARSRTTAARSCTPDRTGSVVDVLYSAAGNSSDEAWYNKNIIAYDFECGVRLFSPTSTSNSGGDPGFTPNFATEGRAEGQEFADGMYGLMSSALEYQNDTTAPVGRAVGAVGHDLADADLARVRRVGAVGHLLHDGRLDADDELDAVHVLGLPRAGGRRRSRSRRRRR